MPAVASPPQGPLAGSPLPAQSRPWDGYQALSGDRGVAGGSGAWGCRWAARGQLQPGADPVRRLGRGIRSTPVLFATGCGLVVALCGLGSDGAVFGTGYRQARALVQGEAGTPAAFRALKLLATAASSVSGIPGGIFAPSLAGGAGLGANFAERPGTGAGRADRLRRIAPGLPGRGL
jgi:H+/Cl- antiporter ClcA